MACRVLFVLVLLFASQCANNNKCISYDGDCDLITTWLLFQYDRSIQPNALGGLQLWLKADVFSNRTDASSISGWPDSSGQGNDAVQGTTSRQPEFYNNQLNSRSTVRFDGTDDFLNVTSLTLNPSTTSYTVLIVFEVAALNDDILLSQSSGTGRTLLFYDFSGVCAGKISSNLNTLSCSNTSYNVNTWQISAMTWENTEFIINFYNSGVFNGSSNTGGVVSSTGSWIIGANSTLVTFINGSIAEIVVYSNIIADSERQGVECYLSKKYALPVSQFCG